MSRTIVGEEVKGTMARLLLGVTARFVRQTTIWRT